MQFKMRSIIFSLALALAATILTAAMCKKSIISGIVSDAATEQGLAAVQVQVFQKNAVVANAVTDAKGVYAVAVPEGQVAVVFSAKSRNTLKVLNVRPTETSVTTLNVALDSISDISEEVVVHYSAIQGTTTRYEGGLSEIVAKSSGRTKSRGVPGTKHKEADYGSSLAPSEPTAVGYAAPVKESRPSMAPATKAISAPALDTDRTVALKDMEETVTSDEVLYKKDAPASGTQPSPRAGLLTAGEWNDLHNWNRHWTDLLNDGEIAEYERLYGFYPHHRATLLLTNEQDIPVPDAAVQLQSASGTILWEARTDNTGKAELWPALFAEKSRDTAGLKAIVRVNNREYPVTISKMAAKGFNHLKINTPCAAPKNADIVWAVDATGSMGDELEYLKTELLDVMARTRSTLPDINFRMGTVFYRDTTDEYLVKSSGLSHDTKKTVDFIKKQAAGGGGDYPEAVHTALEEAIFNQRWSDNAIARICFLVLDASPHNTPEVNASLQRSIREAARCGIRIVPVASSGVQKDTEFLLKFFGLATNGTYVFLTDHSGIGGKHLAPTTDEYKVENLNNLLIRLLTEYCTTENCEGQSSIRLEDPQQPGNSWQALYYPNPASGHFTLELPVAVQVVTLYNSEGQAVKKVEKPAAGQHRIEVAGLPDGFYTMRILKEGQWQSGKLVVVSGE
jgi:hypothetical protein